MTRRDKGATCHITVYSDPVPGGAPRARYDGHQRVRGRRCGKPVAGGGLCARHLADKRRLT